MKQVISDLLAKATAFLQQLAANNPGNTSADTAESIRSVSPTTLNLRSRTTEDTGSTEVKSESVEVLAEETVLAPVVSEEAVVSQIVVEPIKPVELVADVAVDSPILVPEDSALRRHFLTQRRAELLADLGDEPSDSTLKRHYQQLVAAKITG